MSVCKTAGEGYNSLVISIESKGMSSEIPSIDIETKLFKHHLHGLLGTMTLGCKNTCTLYLHTHLYTFLHLGGSVREISHKTQDISVVLHSILPRFGKYTLSLVHILPQLVPYLPSLNN